MMADNESSSYIVATLLPHETGMNVEIPHETQSFFRSATFRLRAVRTWMFYLVIAGFIGLGVLFIFTQNMPWAVSYDTVLSRHARQLTSVIVDEEGATFYDLLLEERSAIESDETGCVVFFDENDISVADAEGAEAVLERIGYFTAQDSVVDAIVYQDDEGWVIALGVDEAAMSDHSIDVPFREALTDLRTAHADRTYAFRLLAVEDETIVGERYITLE